MATTQMTQMKTVSVADGTKVFYREQSNNTSAPIFLLLHGFPSSSHQYRNLIPLLAQKYRVIAPDLPGFGFTEPAAGYKYTFEDLAKTIGQFVDALEISKFSLYIFDYGAPVGLRLALTRPNAAQAIVTQNGNAYVEGFGDVWGPIQQLWAGGNSSADRAAVAKAMLNEDITKFQYLNGTPDPNTIAPESYTLDYALLSRPGNQEIQLDLFNDYQYNVQMYEKFQGYFRESQVPLLAIWGKNDVFFIPPGAEAFKKDLPRAQVELIDAGHFAVESHTEMIAEKILAFLK
ncbi:hydrolase-like protein [Pochonia chlamydosporia 170]|uniref:Hydrolase-like protein n=1 Tax=Pochonia chlamydosporia 170 TaxID=1380566 RepID=A0A179FI80_METCM|nr:hydrolase-like protein [Pochonia chlamydosporia 170]OAQ65335.1 hydrolase-like protein [Pochonia chlamydosporia 170]